jgi:Ion channel
MVCCPSPNGVFLSYDLDSTDWRSCSSSGAHAMSAVCRGCCVDKLAKDGSVRRHSGASDVILCALVMRAKIAIIILQGIIILLWACCYRWLCFPSWNSAFYFSATSYSTVGYGDVVVPLKWWLLGPLESMMGVLMCGIAVSLPFALITRLVDKDPELGIG